MDTETSEFFVAGGALPLDAPSYVRRRADDQLFESVLSGRHCYVFAAQHMGKSSLMVRAVERLQGHGVRTACADLTGFETGVRLDQSYLHLIKCLNVQLKLSLDPEIWWTERDNSQAVPRFQAFLRDVVLQKFAGPIAIFLDGFDTSLDRGLRDDLLGVVRAIYDARITDSAYGRLTVVCLGTSSFTKLIADHGSSPFEVGQQIELGEFSQDEARVLQRGLEAAYPESGEAVFSRIFHWTDGHPYLTQRLCLAAIGMPIKHWTSNQIVDWLVRRLFVVEEGYAEPNLQLMEDRIKASRRRAQLLSCYRQVYHGQEVSEDEQSDEMRQLKLLGLVKAENGILKVSNEVYRLAFDLNWIKANIPVNWARRILVMATLFILVLAVVGGFLLRQQRSQPATDASELVDNLENATIASERLSSLAGLFNEEGHEDQARQLFYEQLSPADQHALFNLVDPQALGEQLVTVVRGVYTDPKLENTEQDNLLLVAMAQSLSQLESGTTLGAPGLRMEIEQWLMGREYHSDQGRYQRAIEAYEAAIRINDRHPGVYFDRGLAYAADGQPNRALTDFRTVVGLSESWSKRVQHALNGDPQLYAALWDGQEQYGSLVALVPTPTNTPTSAVLPSPTPVPTVTPLPPPSSTRTAQPTPASTRAVPPTRTSTAQPIPTLSLTATAPPVSKLSAPRATQSPTPGIPAGTVVLLTPSSSDPLTFGPTSFEWEWSGVDLKGLGFEVRVWREGEPPAGVHDAMIDNLNGSVANLGENRYRLAADITYAPGVQGRSGTYFWTVALVQVDPTYVDLGHQARPAQLRFDAGGAPDTDGGGGGVGID